MSPAYFMKRDGYEFSNQWESWKSKHLKGIEGVRKQDHKLLIEFLIDMENGNNTPPDKKGKRGAGTLLNLATHNTFFLRHFKKPFLKLKREDVLSLEKDIEDGKILKRNGKKFEAFGDYIKDLKPFYNWLIRTDRIKIRELKDNILFYSSSKTDKPKWVYLDENQSKSFLNGLLPYYRAIGWFMYDSGARVTEANSIQIKHFSKDFKQVTIPDEAAKTFGRTINLKLSSDLIKDYVKENGLKDDDFLFQKDLWTTNKYLKENCGKKFGKDKISNHKSGGAYGNFTLYDIRHCSACFWLSRYPTHKDLMYRFGWKNADKVDYYTAFLGQSDKLSDADMILSEDKPKLFLLEKDNKELKTQVQSLTQTIENIKKMMVANAIGKAKVSDEEKEKVKKAMEIILNQD